jgi:hypothetical protein
VELPFVVLMLIIAITNAQEIQGGKITQNHIAIVEAWPTLSEDARCAACVNINAQRRIQREAQPIRWNDGLSYFWRYKYMDEFLVCRICGNDRFHITHNLDRFICQNCHTAHRVTMAVSVVHDSTPCQVIGNRENPIDMEY